VKVDTKWFGTVEISEQKIITFEKGLMGFEDYKKFVIVYELEEDREHSIMWLQSLDEVSLALPVIKPELIKEDYDPVVEDELVFGLGENIRDANLLVLVTLTVPQDIKKMTCNLKAPLIINTDTMKAVQLVANNEDYVVRYPIYEILDKRKKEG
jgi:flagellar assembly factor FliW